MKDRRDELNMPGEASRGERDGASLMGKKQGNAAEEVMTRKT